MVHLRNNEKIIRIIRHHWSAVAGIIFSSSFILAILLIAKLYFNFNFFGYDWQVIGFCGLLAGIFILYKVYIWRKNGIYVTNQRLVNNEQNGFFTKTVTEFLYQDIHEIKYKQRGLPASMSNYGTLIIKTFANDEIVFNNIPNPEEIVDLINKIKVSNNPMI